MARSAEEISFWFVVNRSPDDPLPRLILADWLDEQGRGHEAEALRWGVRERLEPKLVVEIRNPMIGISGRASPRNLNEASRFLTSPGNLLATVAAWWQGLAAAWSLCRRAGVDPTADAYDRSGLSRWYNDANLAISFALAQMPDDKRWEEKEQRKVVSAAYPFGVRQYHPYKVWLQQVNRRLGKKPKRPAASAGSLFDVFA